MPISDLHNVNHAKVDETDAVIAGLKSEMGAAIDRFSKEFHGVMAGCSAGLDSTTLFHLIAGIAKPKKNFEVGLIHINYGLRGVESEADQRFVEELSRRACVSIKTYVVSDQERLARQGEGIQQWARTIRMNVFREVAKSGYVIALGHHRDDVTENVLMRLCRGASPGALAGLRVYDPPLWRPMLAVSKQELRNFARREKIVHREDATNAKLEYTRNIIRHTIIPELEKLFPGAGERIAACAFEARDISDFCRAELECGVVGNHGEVPLKWLREASPGLGLLGIQLSLSRVFGGHRQWSRSFLYGVLSWAKSAAEWTSMPFQTVRTGGQITVSNGYLQPLAGERVVKASRAEQHERNRSRCDYVGRLGPLARAEFADFSGKKTLEIRELRGLYSLPFRVYFPKLSEILGFPRHNRQWKFKELLRVWGAKSRDGLRFLAVTTGSNNICLFDGDALFEPGVQGSKQKYGDPDVAVSVKEI